MQMQIDQPEVDVLKLEQKFREDCAKLGPREYVSVPPALYQHWERKRLEAAVRVGHERHMQIS